MTLCKTRYENLDRPGGLKNTDCRQHFPLIGRKLLFFESSQHNVPPPPLHGVHGLPLNLRPRWNARVWLGSPRLPLAVSVFTKM